MSHVGTLSQRTILVVEDEYLVARDLTEELELAGAEVLGPVATLSAALRLIARSGRIDAAVLDVKLGTESVYPVAEALRRRGIPFVFCTGYHRDALAPAFRDALLCEKPSEPSDIIRVLQGQFRRQVVA